MDLSPIITHLRATLTGLRSVGGAADLNAAFGGIVATPAAFVLPLAESAADMGMLSTTGERVTQTFGVVHGISNARDSTGSAALEDLAALRQNLRVALVGWVPNASNGEAVAFSTGHLLQMDGNNRLWWIDEFTLTSYYWSA